MLPAEKHYQPPGALKALMVATGVVMGAIFLAFLSMLISPAAPAFVFVGATMGYVGMNVYQIHKGANLNLQGVQELNSGNVEVAAAIFEDLSKNYRSHPHHALFVHNRGVCYLVDGHPRRACSLFNAVRTSKRLKTFALRRFRHYPTTQLALALGLLGEVREANSVLREAEDDSKHAVFGMTVVPRAVIYLREGQPGRALEHLTRHWTEAEGLAAGRSAKALRILRAFASEQSRQNTHEIERLMAGVYPFEPREIQWLWSHWPELEDFAARHL